MPGSDAAPEPGPGLEDVADALVAAGVRIVVGTMVNAAGLTLAKAMPTARLASFVRNGAGVAPVADVYAVDGAIAFIDGITAVGDRRLRIDAGALVDVARQLSAQLDLEVG